MKELDPFTLLAVFQELLGPLLWLLLAVVLLNALALIVLLIRERGVVSHRLIRSQALGVLGGGVAVMLMFQVSSSGFTDPGGPADWFLIALVFGLGLIGSTILFYTIGGWWSACRRPAARSISA
ncbi:hypothetical protein CR159_10090 [Pollutimonas subterranea]|uniref:Uncharacterized protein n=1 Tax=Pollutimonas subterranea TaxID=2045210 RepID=A0A2N4U4P2_9BURK|nr:DUF5368 domain-containing protein [Pollutimonas subterranea]PLC49979.1 hypothetical protein CR159_10090 [Pollutimonas subterranea]